MLRRKARFWVYMIRCRDKSLYTGYTTDLENRLETHKSGRGAKYLRGKGPLKLVYNKEYRSLSAALKEEIRIKALKKPEKLLLIRKYTKKKRGG
jgi:putative endonuclease